MVSKPTTAYYCCPLKLVCFTFADMHIKANSRQAICKQISSFIVNHIRTLEEDEANTRSSTCNTWNKSNDHSSKP